MRFRLLTSAATTPALEQKLGRNAVHAGRNALPKARRSAHRCYEHHPEASDGFRVLLSRYSITARQKSEG